MSLTFEHTTLGQRVLFGSGKAAQNLAAEVARLGAGRVMVIASEFELPMAERVAADIDPVLWHTCRSRSPNAPAPPPSRPGST
jgi:maleylacetate reductase